MISKIFSKLNFFYHWSPIHTKLYKALCEEMAASDGHMSIPQFSLGHSRGLEVRLYQASYNLTTQTLLTFLEVWPYLIFLVCFYYASLSALTDLWLFHLTSKSYSQSVLRGLNWPSTCFSLVFTDLKSLPTWLDLTELNVLLSFMSLKILQPWLDWTFNLSNLNSKSMDLFRPCCHHWV